MKQIYSSVFEDAAARFRLQLLQELDSPEFPWNKLISLILEEDSPLQDLLTSKTLQLAGLYEAASKVYQSASELDEVDNAKAE